MTDVILMRPDPDLAKATLAAIAKRVRDAEDALFAKPIGVTLPEARVLVAMMNDQWAEHNQSNMMMTEPKIGDEGTVLGYQFVVVTATNQTL